MPRTIQSSPALAGLVVMLGLVVTLLGATSCVESNDGAPGLDIQIFTTTAPNLDPIPADMPFVRVILKDASTDEVLTHRTYGIGDSGAAFPELPFNDNLQIVIEGLDVNKFPIQRGQSTPFAFQPSSQPRRVPVFFSRLEAFSEATTLTTSLNGGLSVQPVRFATAQTRAGHTLTQLTGGRLLVTGGAVFGPDGDFEAPFVFGGPRLEALVGAAEVYDPATGVFFALPEMNTPRAFHTATQLADGRILVVGGITVINTDDGPVIETVRPAEIFDPQTSRWTEVIGEGSLVTGRAWHTATLRRIDGKVVVVGGRNIARGESRLLGDAEVFNPLTNRFELNPGGSPIEMITPRAEHQAVLARGGAGAGSEVVIIGGLGESGPVSALEVLRSVNNNELLEFADTLPPLSEGRYGHQALPLGVESGALIVVVGGLKSGDAAARSVEIIDPVTGTVAEAGVIGGSRGWLGAVELQGTNNLVLTGGVDGAGELQPGAEVLNYNATTGKYTSVVVSETLNAPRSHHQVVLLSNGLMLITGGVGEDGETLNRIEVFNPNDGSPLPAFLP